MTSLLRWFGRALLVFYVLVAIVVLAVRYWLLPNIDHWREPIEQVLSAATASQLSIGRLEAEWSGLLPEIHIHHLEVKDANNQQSLHIPYIEASLKWRSLLAVQPHFSHLLIDGLKLVVWRNSNDQFHLAGQAVDLAASETGSSNTGLLTWLAQQDQIELRDAQLLWRDDSRDAEPLLIHSLDGLLQHDEHVLSFDLRGQPQVGLETSRIQLLGQFDWQALHQNQIDGMFYVVMNSFSPKLWHQWVDLPTNLSQATVDTQFWMLLEQSQIKMLTMDTVIHDGVWESTELGRISAQSLRVFSSAPWATFQAVSTKDSLADRLQNDLFHLEVYGQDLKWNTPALMSDGLVIDSVSLVSQRDTPNTPVRIQQLALTNADFEAQVQGDWTPKGADLSVGEFDLTGQLQKVKLSQLYQYFPMPDIPENIVVWLKEGLTAGVMDQVVMRLVGSPAQFPYTDPSTGLFYVGGAFSDTAVDYYPSTAEDKGWPKVEQADGYLAIRANSLWVQTDKALIKPDTINPVQAQLFAVHIDDFSADEPILTVKAHTTGPAQSYLGLMTHTDLGMWLDHTFDNSTATGHWAVPFSLRINLENDDDAQVNGYIDFEKNTLHLMDYIPDLESITGRLYFTEQGAKADQLQGYWVGGPVRITNQIGKPEQMLQIEGQFAALALLQYFDVPLTDRLQGHINYEAKLGLDKDNHFYVSAQSALQGLESSFPAPLSKTTAMTMPIQLSWQAFNTKQHQLRVNLVDKLHLHLIESTENTELFSQGSLAWQQPLPKLPKQGLAIDIQQNQLDAMGWKAVLMEMGLSDSEVEPAVNSLPEVVSLRIKTDQTELLGAELHQLTYTLQQSQPLQWRADISSDQIAGTVRWHTNVQGDTTGVVQADLQRLHWQKQNTTSTAETTSGGSTVVNDTLSLPDLRLTIADLRIDDWHLGSVMLTGVNKPLPRDSWELSSLQMHTPYGDLQATGHWQLGGEQRGLQLEAQLQTDQAGALLDYIGLPEVLLEGNGTAQAQLRWYDFPWNTDMAALEAEVQIHAQQGRINQINSRAAKLLEVLSLQSLSRLARLDFDLRGLTKNGFPFNDINAQAQLENNVLSIAGVRVLSPVGTIVLEGHANLNTETLDLEAVVVPNIDMSGATIAAGIALNPIVGIGAFLTQLLFNQPLTKAMTVQYHVTGSWDDIKTEELKK